MYVNITAWPPRILDVSPNIIENTLIFHHADDNESAHIW